MIEKRKQSFILMLDLHLPFCKHSNEYLPEVNFMDHTPEKGVPEMQDVDWALITQA